MKSLRNAYLLFLTLGLSYAQAQQWTVETRGAYQFGADLEDFGDEFDVTKWTAGASVGYANQIGRGTFYEFGLGYDYENYNFGVGEVGAGGTSTLDRIEDVDRVSTTIQIIQGLSREWAVGGFAFLEWAASEEADLGDGFSYAVSLGPVYSFSEDLRVGVGVAVFQSSDDEANVFPIAYLDWRVNDDLRIFTRNGVFVEYAYNDSLLFDASVSYESSAFAVRDLTVPTVNPGEEIQVFIEEGTIEDQGVLLTLGVSETIGGVKIRAYGTWMPQREMEFREDEDFGIETDLDDTFGVGLSAEFQW